MPLKRRSVRGNHFALRDVHPLLIQRQQFKLTTVGALHKGTADLDLETEHVTREVSLILQALIILSVSAEGLWAWLKRRRTR